MGYYTYYSLEVDPDTAIPDIVEALKNNPGLADTNLYGYALDWGNPYDGMIPPLDNAKWYEHNENMLILSKLFPQVLFTLSGEGEESGDLWRTKYQDGKLATVLAETYWAEFPPLEEPKPQQNKTLFDLVIEPQKTKIELGD